MDPLEYRPTADRKFCWNSEASGIPSVPRHFRSGILFSEDM